MKYLFSISFIFIYLLGVLQPSWILIDFYWNRDDYTQKFCINIDEGITKCRASCYLDNLIEDQQHEKSEAKFISIQQSKMTELISWEIIDFSNFLYLEKHRSKYVSNQHHIDFFNFIFRPPKGRFNL